MHARSGIRFSSLWLIAGAAGVLLAARGGQAQAEQPADGRLQKTVTLEVRSATVGTLLDRLSDALKVPMEADRELSGERLTMYATSAKLLGLQDALASLHHSAWSTVGLGDASRYRLRDNQSLRAQAEALRQQRRTLFVNRLLALHNEVESRGARSVAARMRADVQRRMSDLPAEALAQITPEYVNQTLLLVPLRFGLTPALLRNDVAWLPLNNLSSFQQRVMASYYLGYGRTGVEAVDAPQPAAEARAGGLDPDALSWPRARVEYRMLYGDRWAGNVLLTRVGTSDSWANAMLSSALFALPDYGSLYPEAGRRPVEADAYRPLTVTIDPTLQTWDQALQAISKAAKINVVSDAFLRPSVFRPDQPKLTITGYTLVQVLDNVAAHYGYVWWKEGDWYLFRNRMWGEERRVAVPDRILNTMGAGLAADKTLSEDALTGLATLSEEQLLTLHLSGRAAGRISAPLEAFDYDEVSLAHAGLMMYSQMTDAQRKMARGNGLPFVVMSPVLQFLFSSLAYDRGVLADQQEMDGWKFTLSDRFERRRLSSGWAEVGQIRMDFDCGASGIRTATLSARAPAVEPAERPAPTEPEPAAVKDGE
jgi:hypothetical protein